MDSEEPSLFFEEGVPTTLPLVSDLQKDSIVGGPVLSVSFPPFQDSSGKDSCLFLARGPFLERHPIVHRHEDNSFADQKKRCLVFPDGGNIHGIRYTSKNNLVAVFGGRKIAMFLSEENELSPPLPFLFGSDKIVDFEESEQSSTAASSSWVSDSALCENHQQKTARRREAKLNSNYAHESNEEATKRTPKEREEAPFSLILPDWIWDVRLQKVNNDSRGKKGSPDTHSSHEVVLVAGMAQNSCDIWRIRCEHGRRNNIFLRAIRLRHVPCEVRCITYCMSIASIHDTHTGGDSLSIAAGTVFNEILIWTAWDARDQTLLDTEIQQDESSRAQVEHRLVGHEGVIHAVNFFHKDGDGPAFVASTSDDRTVRLWKQNFDPNSDKPGGFVLQWTGYGHTARVWDVAYSSHVNVIVSTGEDGTTRVWNIDTGVQQAELRGHSGSISLWQLDVCGSLIAAGCNDGTAKVWNLNNHLINFGDEESDSLATRPNRYSCPVPNDIMDHSCAKMNGCALGANLRSDTEANECNTLSPSALSKKGRTKKAKKTITGQVIFGMKLYRHGSSFFPNKLLVATRSGSLISYDLFSKEWIEQVPWWTNSFVKGENTLNTSNGSCIAIHKFGDVVAIGTTLGDIVLVPISNHRDSLSKDAAIDSRMVLSARNFRSVQGLTWKDESSLMTFHIKGIVILWRFSMAPTSSSLYNGFDMQVSRHVFSMGVVSIPLCFATDKEEKRLLIGDSRGNIAIFDLENMGQDTEEEKHPVQVMARVHKREHVTDIVCCNDNRVISVGNDGNFREHLMEDNGTMRNTLSTPAPSLSGMNRVWLVTKGDDDECIIVSGYHGNIFVVLDVSNRYEIFRADTGGRQRLQDCFIDLHSSDSCSFPLAYQFVTLCQNGGRNEIILQHYCCDTVATVTPTPTTLNLEYSMGVGMHSETIYDVCFCETHSGEILLLSGSEDCGAKLSTYKNGTLVYSKPLQPHESCVRAVCCSRDDFSESSLLVTCGGKLSIQFYVVKPSEDKSTKQLGPHHSVRFLGRGEFPSKPAIEQRIYAVKAISLAPTEYDCQAAHLVVAGDSNGCVYLFLVSTYEKTDAQQFSTAGHILYEASRPILAIDILPIKDRLLVFVGSTGGDIIVWDLPGFCFSWEDLDKNPIFQYDAHQTGTNSISATVLSLEPSSQNIIILICSGGDDQAIVTCTAAIQQDGPKSRSSIKIISRSVTREASHSAIKGMHIIDKNRVLSIGYSQRLALWRINETKEGGHELMLLSNAQIDISDVNCLACRSYSGGDNSETLQGVVAVGGEGIEFLSF